MNKLQVLYNQAVEINKKAGYNNKEYTDKLEEIRRELLNSLNNIK